MSPQPQSRVADRRRIQLIGVPTDAGASRRGACMGPAALRVAGLPERLAELGYDVEDCGDITIPQGRTVGLLEAGSPASRLLDRARPFC